MATAELQSALAQFVTFARSQKGDEKSEAQLFLGRPFPALGQDNRTLVEMSPRKLPQFSEFVRKIGLAAYWDKYGPPDGCQRKSPGDYVCD